MIPDDYDSNDSYNNLTEQAESSKEAKQWIFKNYWTKDFKEAKRLLKDDDVNEKDYLKVYQLLFSEAKKENPFAKYQIASLTTKGKGTEKSETLAQAYYKEAFESFFSIEKEKQNDLTEFYLGSMSKFGNGTQADMDQAANWYLKSARLGNQFSQYALGKMYYAGVGVPQSYSEAFKLYEKSANENNAYAQYALGKMYYAGIEVDVSYKTALELF